LGASLAELPIEDYVFPINENSNLQPILTMLRYTLAFLLIAILAGWLGFWAISGVAAAIAKVLFLIFLVLFICTLIFRSSPPAV
jgi:uncharacterized membrane protein YtjA (UPF0391 family)